MTAMLLSALELLRGYPGSLASNLETAYPCLPASGHPIFGDRAGSRELVRPLVLHKHHRSDNETTAKVPVRDLFMSASGLVCQIRLERAGIERQSKTV